MIFSLMRSFEEGYKDKLLSCEGEIFTYIIENGPSRPKEIIENSRYSSVSVFLKLNQLCSSGRIIKVSQKQTKTTLYKINDSELERIYQKDICF